jgi:hypothetical protein
MLSWIRTKLSFGLMLSGTTAELDLSEPNLRLAAHNAKRRTA